MLIHKDNINLIYKWFCLAMKRAGRKVSAPKDTDFTKTYQYRAIQTFQRRVDEWDFDADTVRFMINAVVDYGKKNKLLHKGTQLLNMKSVLDICLSEMEPQGDITNSVLNGIRLCHEEFGEMTADELAAPRRLGGLSNLAMLLDSGNMPITYLAISKKACIALDRIDRDDYPDNRALLKIRAKLLFNADIKPAIIDIMGRDLNTVGLVGSVTCN